LFRFFFKRVFWSFHPEPSDKISVGLTLRAWPSILSTVLL
jgi:hypothetical protein